MSLIRRVFGGERRILSNGGGFGLYPYGDGMPGNGMYGAANGNIPSNSWMPESSSGVHVNDYSALTLSTFYACVRLLADCLACLPWDSYRNKDNARIKVDPQPSLLKSPSVDVNTFDWKHVMMVSLAVRGNFYGLVTQRDALDYPTDILPLHPDWVVVNRDPETGVRSWFVNGTKVNDPDMFHVRAFTMPGYDLGLSPVQMFAQNIGLSLAAEKFGGNWFRDGAAPSSTLETDQQLSPEQVKQTQQQWITTQGGRRLPAVLSGGFKWQPVTITPEESQFLECVVPGTPVTMADGRRVPVQNLRPGDRVLSWDGEKFVAAPVAHVGTPPVKQLVRIRTVRGRELTASADHPILTRRTMRTPGGRPATGTEWIQAGDLTPGQHVRVALGTILGEPQDAATGSLSTAEAYLLGALVGDGYLRTGSCSFTCAEPSTVERVDAILRSMGGQLKYNSRYDYTLLTGGCGGGGSRIRDLLNASGQVGRHSHDKTVPAIVEAAGPDVRAAFLSGYFDADGSVRDPAGTQNPAAHFNSTSRDLLQGCQHLLASLGIQSSLKRHGDGGSKVVLGQACDTHPSWTLYVTGDSQLRALALELDLANEKKRSRLAGHLTNGPTRYREDNFLFDRVVEVEHLGLGETVGVEIEGTHTFVTAGIVTHNTRQFQVAEIARMFGIPPHMVGDVDRSTSWGTGIEQMSVGFVTYTLGPWLARIEAAINRITPNGQFVKFAAEGLLRGDVAGRYTAYETAINTGWMCPDEARSLEDLPPIPGGKGALYRQPLNFGPLGYIPPKPVAPKPVGPATPAVAPTKTPTKTPAKTPVKTPAKSATPSK